MSVHMHRTYYLKKAPLHSTVDYEVISKNSGVKRTTDQFSKLLKKNSKVISVRQDRSRAYSMQAI